MTYSYLNYFTEHGMMQEAFNFIYKTILEKNIYDRGYVWEQLKIIAELLNCEVVPKHNVVMTDSFQEDLAKLIKHHRKGLASRSSDESVAKYMIGCLHFYDIAVRERDHYRGTL
jgi:hypothetical protein